MAFQQPTRLLQQPRIARADSEDGESAILSPPARQNNNESQTWVLFTPGTDAGTTTSYLSSVQDDQATPGRSRISDLGSLDTAARFEFNSAHGISGGASGVYLESAIDDDAELDSLDSHLPDFRTASSPFNLPDNPFAAAVFPSHDGLGSFRLDAPGFNADTQERLYAFEQLNPNRILHRRESFDLARLELENEETQEMDRNRRIEAWRLEQSQLLLDDIRKETKRRRKSQMSKSKAGSEKTRAADVVSKSVADEEADDINLAETEWHDQDQSSSSAAAAGGLWSRITRKVICDLMGLDDNLLCILFGEALPDEDDLASTPKDSSSPAFAQMESDSQDDSIWQLNVLERVAKELGMFVNHISRHPGAFSTYTRVQQTSLPYAGLPVIPEMPVDVSERSQRMGSSAASMPQFRPTVDRSGGATPAEASTQSAPSVATAEAAATCGQTFTQQEWEQELDIRLVFRYLRSRFTSSHTPPPSFTSGTSHLATTSTQDLAAKAARVRQHHPLISHTHTHGHAHHRTRPAERRTFKVTTPSSPVAMRHASGSCASQSTRRSARRSSMSSRQSSRHYWDIGGNGSIGTGSMIASAGPMGSWGEV